MDISTHNSRMNELLKKYAFGSSTHREELELAATMENYSSEENIERLMQVMLTQEFTVYASRDNAYDQYDWQPRLESILKQAKPGLVHRLKRFSYAAAIILLVVVAGLVWLFRNNAPQQDSCGLVIPSASEIKDERMVKWSFNGNMQTISISPGWQFETSLPDGTKVLLNTGSSVSFPRNFSTGRQVRVEGEVFLDVVKNAKEPLRVFVKDMQLDVLGTSFNVNAYSDDGSVYTTLVSGSLRATSSKGSILLRPGQEAVMKNDSLKVQEANLARSGAWKDGVFYFRNTGLKDAMTELSRWYGWQVHYDGTNKNQLITASLCRRSSEKEALKTLRDRGIKFVKSQNKITIYD